MTAWYEDAGRTDLFQVATELGMDMRDRRLAPCPSCGERTRGKIDARIGALFLVHQGRRWRCGRCKAGGDALDLVALVQFSRPCDNDAPPEVHQWVRGWFASRGWCEADASGPEVERVIVRPPALQPERTPAPPAEVAELWERSDRVSDSSIVQDWLRSRALDPGFVEDRDLCRVLPGGPLPAWARHWRSSKPCPVLLPLYGADGSLVGLQGRRVDGAQPKSVAAAGVRRVGVYADATGIALLRWGARPAWWEGKLVIIAEGEPDFLTWATHYHEGPDAPAVLGIPGAGGWAAEIAARVPAGLVVAVRTHDDSDGHKYARLVTRDLRERCDVRTRRAT